MSNNKPPVGSVGWFDLTVPDAEAIRDFYSHVIGWKSEPVPMGEYEDYAMVSPDSGDPMAGVCYARGSNAHLPPVWMIYVNVDDIDASVSRCLALGGKLVGEIRSMGKMGRYCAIQDPAGAVLSLFQPTG